MGQQTALSSLWQIFVILEKADAFLLITKILNKKDVYLES
jgi:hypothetical protein